MSVGQFLTDSIEICQKHDIKIELYPRRNLPDQCSGSFEEERGDGKPGLLRVATGEGEGVQKWDWLEIYAHEFCHLQQFIGNAKVYNASDKPSERLFTWLEDKTAKKPSIKDIRAIQAMEMDCDKRVLKYIDRYRLPINRERHVKKANLYLWFYPQVLARRKWVGKGKLSPYRIKEAYRLSPVKFLPLKKYMHCPDEIAELMDRYTF